MSNCEKGSAEAQVSVDDLKPENNFIIPENQITRDLNDEQLAAVVAPPDRHYLILAGAGCGKTTVLTRRIAYLSACNIPLSSILALTFTRKAAEEMAERVHRLTCTLSPKERPAITTFHAFALKILSAQLWGKTNFSRIGFSETPLYHDEKERLGLLVKCCSPDERRLLGADIYKIDAMVERLNVFPESILKVSSIQAELIRKIAARFKEQKKREGVWDFSDLIEGAVKLFRSYPEVLEHYRNKYCYILVDEFQDTNPLQIQLLHLMLGNDKKIFAVGDDDQAIYGFRGADIRPTINFSDIFSGAQIIKLQTNYRSVPAILSRANRIFQNKNAQFRKVLVSGRYMHHKGENPSIHFFADQTEMADWLIAKTKECSDELKVSPNSMAALFRINQSIDWMTQYLDRKGIDREACPLLLTVHKSKGLEFPAVFVCDMEESLFPNYRSPDRKRLRTFWELLRKVLWHRPAAVECDFDEEKRLFYVAVTRAQLRLFFLVSRYRRVYGKNRRFKPSRFLRLI